MFLHTGFLHILFNILWLYWFGRVFLQYFTQKQLTGLYLLGGLMGAVFFLAAYNLFPVFDKIVGQAKILGASASVMAVAIAISFYVPNYSFNLLLIGRIQIKYIAVFFIITDILTIRSDNAGGHLAHLGGALMGYLFASQVRSGRDLTKGLNRLLDEIVSVFKPRPKVRVTYRKTTETTIPKDDLEYNAQKKASQEEIDRILDKIAKSGYDNLSKKEKEILFKAGK
jgi:hypothetical protein